MRQNTLTMLTGLALGAGLMYMLDPERGRRRRSLARDQVTHAVTRSGDAIEPTLEDLENRARGAVYGMRTRMKNKDVDDEVLVRRVRSKMGRYVSHVGSITVTAHNGHVTLQGPILANEVRGLLKAVRSVPGVKKVDNQLTEHETPSNIPGLQGGSVPDVRRENQWAPATRLLVGTAGSALTLAGARQRGPVGMAMSALGITALGRAISNIRMKRMFGVGAGRRAIYIQKTINVDATPEEVYEFWSNFENFPRFMSHLKEVQNLGGERSHWVAEGPAGTKFKWDAVTTERVPNRMIAWRSLPGSTVQNAGMVHFTPNAQGGTQIHVQMSYNPPAGAIGHTIADLFGDDAITAMDDDLMRLKSLIETGKTTADSQTVTRDQMEPTG